jgi:hypothetical protein
MEENSKFDSQTVILFWGIAILFIYGILNLENYNRPLTVFDLMFVFGILIVLILLDQRTTNK